MVVNPSLTQGSDLSFTKNINPCSLSPIWSLILKGFINQVVSLLNKVIIEVPKLVIEETNYELNFAPTFSEVNMANKLLNCTYIKSTKPNLGRQQLKSNWLIILRTIIQIMLLFPGWSVFMTDYLALSVSTISFLHAWLLKEMVWKQHYDEDRILFQAGC